MELGLGDDVSRLRRLRHRYRRQGLASTEKHVSSVGDDVFRTRHQGLKHGDNVSRMWRQGRSDCNQGIRNYCYQRIRSEPSRSVGYLSNFNRCPVAHPCRQPTLAIPIAFQPCRQPTLAIAPVSKPCRQGSATERFAPEPYRQATEADHPVSKPCRQGSDADRLVPAPCRQGIETDRRVSKPCRQASSTLQP
jgi:hypothetical protein